MAKSSAIIRRDILSAFERRRVVGLVFCVAAFIAICCAFPSGLGAPRNAQAAPRPKRHSNGVVIHFGDSFVAAGLQQSLRPRFTAMDTAYVAFPKTAAFLADWAFGRELEGLYWAYKPSLYLITLGTNDVGFVHPEKRAHMVREIVRRLHGTPCVWISIPLWHDNLSPAVTDMIRRECQPCRHFDSSALASKITRQRDRIHPDADGGALWADAVWSWLQGERDVDKGFWALKPAPEGEYEPNTGTDLESSASSEAE